MAISKVVYGGSTLVDLTADTVSAGQLASGVTAHDATGQAITGTAEITETHTVTLSTSKPTSSNGSEGDVWLVGSGSKTDGDNVGYELSTNYGTYAGALDNLKSTSTSTYWWSSENQSSGKYILVTFDAPVTLTSFVTYCSKSGDRLNTNNVLQVSSDGSTWTTVGTFKNQTTNTFTGSYSGVKYARIYASSSVSYWLYINYISMAYTGSSAWDYEITSVYKRTSTGWAGQDDMSALKSGAWTFS